MNRDLRASPMLAILDMLLIRFCQRRATVARCLKCPREHASDARQSWAADGFQDNRYIHKEVIKLQKRF